MSQGIMRWWDQRLGRPVVRGEIPVTRDEDGDGDGGWYGRWYGAR